MAEVLRIGLVAGIQSFLHKRVGYFFPGYDTESKYEPVLYTTGYHEAYRIVLPEISKPEVSIIIPVYNQELYTYNCIRSIWEHCGYTGYEIIIADDNSPEGNEFLRLHLINAIIIKNPVNLGFLKNCNHAATYAKGKYLVFLNNDIIVRKGWLTELLSVFQLFPQAGLVGSKLIYPDGRLQEAGGIIWQDGSGWNYGNGHNPDKPEYNYVKETDYISGASIMIPAALWKEIGGFDERYSPAYCEDSDLCFEVRKHGRQVIYQPFSVAVHFEGKSHGTDLNSGIKQYQSINVTKLVEKWAGALEQKSKNGKNVFSERDRSGHKKHILIVDHDLPTVDKDAGSRTMSNYVDALLTLGLSVHYLTTNPDPAFRYRKQLQEKGVETLYNVGVDPGKYKWDDHLKQNSDKYEFILLSRSSVCYPLLIWLRNNDYQGKVIYYGHDLGYLRMAREAVLKKDISIDLEAKYIKAVEDFMYEHADCSLMISYDELEYMRKNTKSLHYIPPYFFDVEDGQIPFGARDGLMFIGGFNHTPNQDAVRWFLDEVYAPLAAMNIKLTIAGSNMPGFVQAYKKKFHLLELMPDVTVAQLNELYAKVRVSVVPLRLGAGVKGKVIEAMAKGVPVAGTSTAFEGMPKDDGFVYEGADSSDELLKNILALYNDEALWERCSGYGKNYVNRYFNRTAMINTFKEITGSVLP